MENRITVKEAKEKLQRIIDKLNTFDDNKPFAVDIADNYGGSYIETDINWDVGETDNNVWLSVE